MAADGKRKHDDKPVTLMPTALNGDLREQANGRRCKRHVSRDAALQPGAQY
jgi:hypothetical protein